MNEDVTALKALLRELGWSEELLSAFDSTSGVSELPLFREVQDDYFDQWRAVDSSGSELTLSPASAISGDCLEFGR